MKKYHIIIFLLFVSFYNSFSQTDSVSINKIDSLMVPEKKDFMYKAFVENRGAETSHLWKMNLVDLALFQLNCGYEHRLTKKISVEGYLRFGEGNSIQIISGNRPNTSDRHSSKETIEVEQLFKYYTNLNRRERYGKKTNGFSGNYFATSILYKNFFDQTIDTDSSHSDQITNINLGIKYGLQRRIGNLGYIELYLGLYYRWEFINWTNTLNNVPPYNDYHWTEYYNYLVPIIGIKAGFAIDSFDNLRRMIKD
jgi:hypothetical protein